MTLSPGQIDGWTLFAGLERHRLRLCQRRRTGKEDARRPEVRDVHGTADGRPAASGGCTAIAVAPVRRICACGGVTTLTT